eukprot:84976-Pyramimonas_sp.AAC.1
MEDHVQCVFFSRGSQCGSSKGRIGLSILHSTPDSTHMRHRSTPPFMSIEKVVNPFVTSEALGFHCAISFRPGASGQFGSRIVGMSIPHQVFPCSVSGIFNPHYCTIDSSVGVATCYCHVSWVRGP